MNITNPIGTVLEFFNAFNNRDIDTALTLYEPGAVFLKRPGAVATGYGALREALGVYLALHPTLVLEKSELVMAGDIALSVIKWTLEGNDAEGKLICMEGTTTDVLRRQPDGRWLFVIDNPWGTAILGELPT